MRIKFEEPEFEVILLDGRDVMTDGSNYPCTSGAYGSEEEVDWDI